MSRLAALLQLNRPLVMGILNITPDSFSDGGRFLETESALIHARQMLEDGADIIDIGGESTRPGAQQVTEDEEINRILPVVQALRKEFDVAISLDTSKAAVMNAAIPEDIDLINDVRALQERGTLEVVAASQLPVCLMHMKGEPRNMQEAPHYDNLVQEVAEFFRERIRACEQAGIKRERLILDIGFGFGKTPEHNLTLLNRLSDFGGFEMPLLVGLSRKSTIGKIVDDRLTGSLSGGLAAVSRGARLLRVHDVAETVAALKVWRSIEQEQVMV